MPRISSAFDIVQVSDPATPVAGRQFLYFKSDGILYSKNSAGVVAQVGSGSAPSNMVTTDTAQTITAVKTFSSIPVVPDASFVATTKLTATGTKDATTSLRGDNTWVTVSPSTIEPADHGFKWWSYDPALANTGATPAGGMLQLVRIYARGSNVVAGATVHVGTAGTTLTNVGFALYTAAGALITSSVNVNGATTTAFQSVGAKAVTFTAQTIVGSFYVAFWTTGTTQPGYTRNSISSVINIGQVAPNLRFATANTALTTAAPATLSAQTSGSGFWCGTS